MRNRLVVCRIYSLVFSSESFQSDEAAQKIEEFVGEQAKEDALWRERSLFTAGCKTVSSRTVINNKEVEEEARKRKSEEMKELGNNSFRTGKFKQAEEYYTSALLQYDQVPPPHLTSPDSNLVVNCVELSPLHQQSSGPAETEQIPRGGG